MLLLTLHKLIFNPCNNPDGAIEFRELDLVKVILLKLESGFLCSFPW